MIRRSTGLLAFLIALLSLPAAAYTGGGNATVMSLGSPSGNCVTWPNSCPTVLNSAAAPLYTLDPTVNASIQSLLTALAAPLPLPTGASTSQLQTTANGYLANISGRVTGNLALDSSVQSLLTTLQAPLTFNLPANAANATNQATANGYLLTLATASASQATGAKQDTGNGSLATIATNSGTQATATNQTRVQSAPGTSQTIALTIQGNAAGVAVPVSGSVTITPSGTQNVTGTGTPGSPAAGVLTIQGNASGVPVPVSGTVTITPSGTQTVTGTVGLSAGSALVGKVGLDQTTPGTTNGVVVNSGSVTTGSASSDGSTTQTTGGTAQSLFSGATPSNGWKVSIPVAIASISTFACYVSDATTTPSGTTAGSQMVYAGGQYATEPGQKPAGPVYVNCPSTGQAISAQRW